VRWIRERDRRHELRCSLRLGLHACTDSRLTNGIFVLCSSVSVALRSGSARMAGDASAKP
jgi:hypothetical protein